MQSTEKYIIAYFNQKNAIEGMLFSEKMVFKANALKKRNIPY